MMMTRKCEPDPEPVYEPLKARDVIDFHIRWNEFRPIAKTIHGLPDLSQDQAETLYWLIELSDRVHKDDL